LSNITTYVYTDLLQLLTAGLVISAAYGRDASGDELQDDVCLSVRLRVCMETIDANRRV